MLEISRALERDMDKAAAGKIPAPPIESFMSDAALTAAEEATRRASEPVRAQDLKPISGAEAAARRTQHGESLPSMPATRRVIPAPFRRQRVVGGRHGKTWQSVRAELVATGDMTELVGLVASVQAVVRRETVAGRPGVATGTDVVLTGIGGASQTVDASALVRVFRA